MSSSANPTIKKTVRTITLSAMLVTILYVQELLLTFLPNIQFTVLLILVYASVLPLSMSMSIVMVYVFIDNFAFGTFSIMYTPGMAAAWITLCLVGYALRHQKFVWIVVFATFFGLIYGWFYIPGRMLEQGITDLKAYLIADLVPFGLILIANNFLTVLIGYRKLKMYFVTLLTHYDLPLAP